MIKRSLKISPLRLVVYGDNGIGKSTFASKAPNPIFIDLEDNINHLDVDCIAVINYQETLNALNYLLEQKELKYKTIVIDSFDVLLSRMSLHILDKYVLNSLEDKYRAGWGLLRDEFKRFLVLVDNIIAHKKVNVIFIAKDTHRCVKNSEFGDYDGIDFRGDLTIAGSLKDWAKAILYLCQDYRVRQTKEGFSTSKKAVLGERIIYTSKSGSVFAKNTYDLEQTIPMDWDYFASKVKEFFAKKINKESNFSNKNVENFEQQINIENIVAA
jgi:hypothetical protein